MPVVQLLLENDAEVKANGKMFGNALRSALAMNHPEVQLLKENGAYGICQPESALSEAFQKNRLEVIYLLLESGA